MGCILASAGSSSARRGLEVIPRLPRRRVRGRRLPAARRTGIVSHAVPGRQISRITLRDDKTLFLLVFRDELMPSRTKGRLKPPPWDYLLTGDSYDGKHDPSLYLHGKSSTNKQAFDRNIVLHDDESYVSSQYVHKYGKVGRSCGCFVLTPQDRERAMQFLSSGSPVFAFGAAGVPADEDLPVRPCPAPDVPATRGRSSAMPLKSGLLHLGSLPARKG